MGWYRLGGGAGKEVGQARGWDRQESGAGKGVGQARGGITSSVSWWRAAAHTEKGSRRGASVWF